jgi:hypothetical protein
MGFIVVGMLVIQFLLVGGYLETVERSSKRSALFGSGLAVLILAMWIGVLALLALDRVGLYAAD